MQLITLFHFSFSGFTKHFFHFFKKVIERRKEEPWLHQHQPCKACALWRRRLRCKNSNEVFVLKPEQTSTELTEKGREGFFLLLFEKYPRFHVSWESKCSSSSDIFERNDRKKEFRELFFMTLTIWLLIWLS